MGLRKGEENCRKYLKRVVEQNTGKGKQRF